MLIQPGDSKSSGKEEEGLGESWEVFIPDKHQKGVTWHWGSLIILFTDSLESKQPGDSYGPTALGNT